MDIVIVGWFLLILALMLFTCIMAWASLQAKVTAVNPRIRRLINITGMCILGVVGVLMATIAQLPGGM